MFPEILLWIAGFLLPIAIFCCIMAVQWGQESCRTESSAPKKKQDIIKKNRVIPITIQFFMDYYDMSESEATKAWGRCQKEVHNRKTLKEMNENNINRF